jgi:alkylhydroperoxidase/carboxymuconolactone decarboxylase family protein YurZ
MSSGLTLEQLRAQAELLVQNAPAGNPLPPLTRAFIQYATRVSVSVLDVEAARPFAEDCLDRGATPAQLHEVLTLVAGLGVHSFMEGSQEIVQLARKRGMDLPTDDDTSQRLLRQWTGGSAYWDIFEAYVPGFLDALAKISPTALEGFMTIGALPGRTRSVPAVTKELISIAVDAMPSHRYMPGLALHVHNALTLGAGSTEVLCAIDLAATVPEHRGVPLHGVPAPAAQHRPDDGALPPERSSGATAMTSK